MAQVAITLALIDGLSFSSAMTAMSPFDTAYTDLASASCVICRPWSTSRPSTRRVWLAGCESGDRHVLVDGGHGGLRAGGPDHPDAAHPTAVGAVEHGTSGAA